MSFAFSQASNNLEYISKTIKKSSGVKSGDRAGNSILPCNQSISEESFLLILQNSFDMNYLGFKMARLSECELKILVMIDFGSEVEAYLLKPFFRKGLVAGCNSMASSNSRFDLTCLFCRVILKM